MNDQYLYQNFTNEIDRHCPTCQSAFESGGPKPTLGMSLETQIKIKEDMTVMVQVDLVCDNCGLTESKTMTFEWDSKRGDQ